MSPSLGFRYRHRDGTVKPRRGGYFYVNVIGNFVLNGEIRATTGSTTISGISIALDRSTVIGVRSQAAMQMGDYPDYIRFGIGGPGTIRGYERSDFRSAHRWVQSLELRVNPWAKRLYKLPFIGITDFQFGLVLVRRHRHRLDATVGVPTRQLPRRFRHGRCACSHPIQDVIRLDVGFTTEARIRPYFSTGTNF